MNNRIYFTTNKTKLAMAYGFTDERTIVSRIRKKLNSLTEEQILALGEWTGNNALMPDQTKVIVELLGTPHDPDMLYSTKP